MRNSDKWWPSFKRWLISGAKNSVVALIPAIILADGIVTLDGVPAISNVDND